LELELLRKDFGKELGILSDKISKIELTRTKQEKSFDDKSFEEKLNS
jgi:hypothetical protein